MAPWPGISTASGKSSYCDGALPFFMPSLSSAYQNNIFYHQVGKVNSILDRYSTNVFVPFNYFNLKRLFFSKDLDTRKKKLP